MKKLFLTILLSTFASAFSLMAQSVTGKVVDETDAPLAYTNVILQTSDSTYLGGTITDTTGRFVIPGHRDAVRVQITFIGYKTEYRTLDNIEVIKLTPDTEVLGKAVVKATLPKTEIKGDAFAPRNPKALKIDFEKRPPYFEVSPTHKARTWLLDPRAPKIDPPEAVVKLATEGVKGYD